MSVPRFSSNRVCIFRARIEPGMSSHTLVTAVSFRVASWQNFEKKLRTYFPVPLLTFALTRVKFVGIFEKKKKRGKERNKEMFAMTDEGIESLLIFLVPFSRYKRTISETMIRWK